MTALKKTKFTIQKTVKIYTSLQQGTDLNSIPSTKLVCRAKKMSNEHKQLQIQIQIVSTEWNFTPVCYTLLN